MSEALRRHVDLLPEGFDLIFHPRRNVLTIEFVQLEAEIVRILEQARSRGGARAADRQPRLRPRDARIMTRILLALIAFYRRWISPALHTVSPGRCKFIPTCSEYAAIAIATHGPLRGCGLAAWRLLRCHPFTPGGFDPVPPKRCRRRQSDPPLPREPLP